MFKQHLTIATRESPLALAQANEVQLALKKLYPNLQIKILGVTTEADRRLNISLTEIGGKGLFVKELEQALLDHRADIAVHSMKDVPAHLAEGLCLPVICERHEARDVFVSNNYENLAALPENAIVGTSSLRRQSQLRAHYPKIKIENLRGNVNTRLNKLDGQEFAALILAAAGLERLQQSARIRNFLTMDECLPAAGQGALGIETRIDDALRDLLAPLNHFHTFACVTAERAVCERLGGNCQVPIAAYADIVDDQIDLRALVARVDGSEILHARRQGSLSSPDAVGVAVAEDLLQQGADKILRELLSY